MARITIHQNGHSVTVDAASGSSIYIPDALPGSAHVTTNDADGPGRPTSNPKTERCDVRLSPSDKKKFLALGGSSWLRKMLRRHGG